MIKKYPIAIEPGGEETAWGVVVPDLPGCFSAADDSLEQAIQNAKQAITLWIKDALEHNEAIPEPSAKENYQNLPEYQDWLWETAEIDTRVF